MSSGQLKIVPIVGFETPFPSLLLLSVPGPRELTPTLSRGDFLKLKIVYDSGGEGVVCVKDTRSGGQVSSIGAVFAVLV